MRSVAVLCAGILAVASSCEHSSLVLGRSDAGTGGQAFADASLGKRDSATACVVSGLAACVPGPSEPTSLGVLGNFASTLGMASLGDQLIIGMENGGSSTAVPSGSFVFVSLVTGAMTVHELGEGYPGSLQAMGQMVVYSQGIPGRVNTSGWSFAYSKVLRWDLQTGEVLELANPVHFDSPAIEGLEWNARGEIFWSLWDRSHRSVIAKWDPCTRASTTILDGERFKALQADDSAVYWQEFNSGYTRTTISSAPIAGGPVSLLFQAHPTDNDVPWLAGSDDGHLYYMVGYGSAPGFFALPKTGGAPSLVIPGGRTHVLAMDDQHIYFTDADRPYNLFRVRKSGEQMETVWHVPDRGTLSVTVDDCNVYWVAESSKELFFRSK